MSWKDDYRSEKDKSGLTWDEYHARYFVHRHDLDDLHTQIKQLTEHVEANKNTYKKMQHELHELRVMEGYEDE